MLAKTNFALNFAHDAFPTLKYASFLPKEMECQKNKRKKKSFRIGEIIFLNVTYLVILTTGHILNPESSFLPFERELLKVLFREKVL